MTKAHQVWQAINMLLIGFTLGQMFNVPGHFVVWLMLAFLVSTALEAKRYKLAIGCAVAFVLFVVGLSLFQNP